MSALIEALRAEHQSMRDLFNLLEIEVDEKGGTDFGLIEEILTYCANYPDQYHHPKEDLVYRALVAADPDAAHDLEDLESEHVIMAFAAGEIRRLARRASEGDGEAKADLPAKMAAFLRFYRDHMRREETEFFPRAIKTLSPEAWMAIEEKVVDPADPMMMEKARQDLDARLAHRGR